MGRIFWKSAFEMLLTHDCPPDRNSGSPECLSNNWVNCEDCWKDWWEKNKKEDKRP
jgi:hypothetical protein